MNWNLFCTIFLTVYSMKSVTSNETTTATSPVETTTVEGQNSTSATSSTTTMPREDYPPADPIPCFFMENITDTNSTLALSERCQNIFSAKNFLMLGQRSIVLNDQLCGVRNESDVAGSAICYSAPGNGIVTSYVHSIILTHDDYYSDYSNVAGKRFLARKFQIEREWMNLYLNSATMMSNLFERITIIQFSPPPTTTTTTTEATTTETETTTLTNGAAGRKKRSTPPQGLDVTAVVQFASNISMNTYQSTWLDLSSNGTKLGAMALTPSGNKIEDMGVCPTLSTIRQFVPENIWNATGPDPTLTLHVASTFSFVCPEGLQLSVDNDGFDAYDNKFTILCNTQMQLQAPMSLSNWPKCVKSCWRRLPPVPEITGLTPVIPPITVPVGAYGRYICNDSSLGVDAGASPYFDVLCGNNTEYEIPAVENDWPICTIKTTTIIPVIPVALGNMLSRFIRRLEYRYKLNDWHPGDENFVPTPAKPYLETVTIPAVIVLIIVIIIILCCSRLDSPCCQICSNEDDHLKKTIVPLEEEHVEDDEMEAASA